MKISTILDQIDDGAIALPEFQRGYVWNRDQVRGLMDSLYRKHPVGSLLVWQTRTENADARGDGQLQAGTVKLLLDGQQRISSLYGILRGKPPKFFDGNPATFLGLHFHLDEQIFQFYGPIKMGGDPRWVDVTELMRKGLGEFIQRINADPELQPRLTAYINRLNAITSIQHIDLHIEEITGEDKTVDVVVEIFNKVNSGGTKLSKGDLALAKICAEWPQARDEMKRRLDRWRKAGFHFKLDWLLRCVNTVVTGEALFTALKDVKPAQFRDGLEQVEDSVDKLLNLIAGRLGLDHDRVLGSRYSFPLLARYLAQRGGHLADAAERDRLLFWYVHSFLWGRYAGSTESVLNQDLGFIEEPAGALDRLIGGLRQIRGDLRLQPGDFGGWSMGARFYPLMYMLTRVRGTRDLDSGVRLSQHLLGKLSGLQVHHIFPKARLYKHGYDKAQVNALANFTFLTQETNLLISDRDPAEYLEQFAAKHPGGVESHWIPMDRELWRVENYLEFLEARRKLLAAAANEFLDNLQGGSVPEPTDALAPSMQEAEPPLVVPGGIGSEQELQQVADCSAWLAEQGLPEGEFLFELSDPETGEVRAMLDLAWPDGLQPGLSQPVTLLLDETRETEEAVNAAGYRYFTDLESFREYVRDEVLALHDATV